MKKFVIGSAILVLLAGCATTDNLLTSLGVKSATVAKIDTVATTALTDGTLVCQYGTLFAAVAGVTVNNATAAAVANACSAISIGQQLITTAVPAPAPTGVTALPVATVPASVVAAVNASRS